MSYTKEEILKLAKEIAPKVKKATDTVSLPIYKERTITVTENVEKVVPYLFILQKTVIEPTEVQKTVMGYEFEKFDLGGWILCEIKDECNDYLNEYDYDREYSAETEYYVDCVVLNTDGTLSLVNYCYSICSYYNSATHRLIERNYKIHEPVTKRELTFNLCEDYLPGHSDAHYLDYKIFNWTKTIERGSGVREFLRNYPMFLSENGEIDYENGETVKIYSDLEGIAERLKKLL